MKVVSLQTWEKYVGRLRKCSETAADKVLEFWEANPPVTARDWQALIGFLYDVQQKYGEAAAEASCEFYEAVADAYGKRVLAAIPAPTASYGETAAAVRAAGSAGNGKLVANVADRLVKRAGVDTVLNNAERDGAEFAWVPHGDTCAFCITLASRGWQKQSARGKNGHASHVHANCDCTYAIRFGGRGGVEGYDPNEYYEKYKNASASNNPSDKINAMRRANYAENADEINAQKRAAYSARKERDVSNLDTFLNWD